MPCRQSPCLRPVSGTDALLSFPRVAKDLYTLFLIGRHEEKKRRYITQVLDSCIIGINVGILSLFNTSQSFKCRTVKETQESITWQASF